MTSFVHPEMGPHLPSTGAGGEPGPAVRQNVLCRGFCPGGLELLGAFGQNFLRGFQRVHMMASLAPL